MLVVNRTKKVVNEDMNSFKFYYITIGMTFLEALLLANKDKLTEVQFKAAEDGIAVLQELILKVKAPTKGTING